LQPKLPDLVLRTGALLSAAMTKAEKIRRTAKLHPNWSTGQIGKACDCRPEYVRVVLRQRVDGGVSEIDKRYLASPLGKIQRQRLLARLEGKRAAYDGALRATGDLEFSNNVAREVYRLARLEGASAYEAKLQAWNVRVTALRKTGDKTAASEAYKAAPVVREVVDA
jgi:hypothetical protein